MKALFRRTLSLLLILVMAASMLPVAYAQESTDPADKSVVLTDEDYASADALFAQIHAMEEAPAKKNATHTQLADAAAALVMESDSYVEGSLERNGNCFTWFTDEGIRCMYNPYMLEKHANMRAPENPEPSGIFNEPKATKGGWPSGNQVYLIAPYYGIDDSFTNQYKNEAKSIATAIGDTDGYTLYSGTSCTVDNVANAISNGAVVIFDSHGTTDYDGKYVCDDPDGYEVYDYVSQAKYSYLCLTNKTGLTTEDYNDGATYFTDSDGVMCACINGATIANHMTKNSPSGLLWMAICLGMATDTFATPLRQMGVEVVYGYSQSVTFAGDYCFEETFWDNMITGKTVAQSVSSMKSRWGEWDWSEPIAADYGYSGTGYTLYEARRYRSAFPIVVSDEDAHPGQRTASDSSYGADSQQTVKSTYTLFSQYNVAATSNNTAYGTVAVDGNTITAKPATGYFAQSATVLSGSATVTQNGNSFYVSASSDCTVQINFAPKTAVTVSFGNAAASQSGYAGDSMTLPTAQALEGYKFIGWMTAPLNGDTTEKPSFLSGSFIPTGNTTLYALYSYVDESTSSGTGDYVKVTETPDDWTGEYLIVYEADHYIFDGSLISFDSTSNYKTVTITNNTISAEDGDPYRFTIASMAGGYSIQGISGKYIGQNSNDNGLTTGTSAMKNTLSVDDGGNVNVVGSGGAYLRYNKTSGQYRFRYYKDSTYSNQQPICLYVKDGAKGTTYYTTNPTKCEHIRTQNVAAVAATCTEGGYTAGVQCVDCLSYISGHQPIAALGHKYGSVITPPTATQQGYTTFTCTTCGHSYVGNYVDALGQTYTVSFSVPTGVNPVADMTCGKSGITLPTAGAPEGYTFEGWVYDLTDATETKPTVLTGTYQTTADVTLYALYSYTEGGSGATEYVLTDISEIGADDVFVITMQSSDTVYALPNNGGANAPTATAVTVSDNKLSSEPSSTLLWNLSGSSAGYIFYVNGSSTNALYCTNANKGVKIGTDSANKFVLDSASGYLKHTGTNRYLGIYNKQDWRCYTSTSVNIGGQTLGFYVKSAGGTTHYTTIGTAEPVVAAVYDANGKVDTYATLADAMAACGVNQYVKLMDDVEEDLVLTKDLYLDLNGHILVGDITGDHTVYGMDSTTNEYGLSEGAIVGSIDNVQIHVFTDEALTGQVYNYMAIQTGDGWTFNRYYVGITHISLDTAQLGLGYKAVLKGNALIQQQLDSFTYTLSLEGGKTVNYTTDTIRDNGEVTLRIKNWHVDTHGQTPLSAYVTIVLDGAAIYSTTQTTTFRHTVEYINNNHTLFAAAKLAAVKDMIQTHDIMLTWDVENLLKEESITEPTVMDPVVGTAYKFGMVQQNISATDIYYLTGAMDGYYMATTTDAAAAIDVYVESAAGGYYLYTMQNGTKTYINMVVSDTHVNGVYEATASTVYRYDAASRTLIAVVNGSDYWFGTRNDKTYTTVGPCAVSYNGFYAQFYLVPQN